MADDKTTTSPAPAAQNEQRTATIRYCLLYTSNKVPYRNPVDAANDLAEGRVQVYEAAFAIVRPQLESGKIKLLAITNSVHAPTLPKLPTVAEAGYPALRCV